MSTCDSYKDSIWDSVESGMIPSGLKAHLKSCEGCRCEMEKARSAMAGFEALRTVDAPDAACAVRQRLIARFRRFSLAYAVTLGILLVCMALGIKSLQRPAAVPDPLRHVPRKMAEPQAPVQMKDLKVLAKAPKPSDRPVPRRPEQIDKQVLAIRKPHRFVRQEAHPEKKARMPETGQPDLPGVPPCYLPSDEAEGNAAVVRTLDDTSAQFVKILPDVGVYRSDPQSVRQYASDM